MSSHMIANHYPSNKKEVVGKNKKGKKLGALEKAKK